MKSCLAVVGAVTAGFVAFVVAFAVVATITGGGGVGEEIGAKVAVQMEVRRYLRSPASADFDPGYAERQGGSGRLWAVIGEVHSQNGFGAMVPTSYRGLAENLCNGKSGDYCWAVRRLVLNDELVIGAGS